MGDYPVNPEFIQLEKEQSEGQNFIRFSPEESKTLFKIAREVRENKSRIYVGDTNGVVFVLMDMIQNFENMPEEQKKILAPLRDKIAQVYPQWLTEKERMEWRFIPLERNIKSTSEFMQSNVIKTAGKSPTDPGEGTFMASYYAEDYAHANPKGKAFVLAAYTMQNMRHATEEESRGHGRNHRYVPQSGTLHDSFRGAILIEMDSQLPDTASVKERIDSKKDAWIKEALAVYKSEVAKLAEAGIIYITNGDELTTMLLRSADAFVAHYGMFVLSGQDSMDELSSANFLKRLPDHALYNRLIANSLPYSIRGKPGSDIEQSMEAVSIPQKLSHIIMVHCESAVKELFKEYNPELKQSSD